MEGIGERTTTHQTVRYMDALSNDGLARAPYRDYVDDGARPEEQANV